MELIDGGMNPVGEELPELDEQRLRSKRENGEMVGTRLIRSDRGFFDRRPFEDCTTRFASTGRSCPFLRSASTDREAARQPGTTFRIQDRRNLIYGFSGRLRNTALTIKSEFFSQKDAGSKANHPLVRHRMLLAVEIASASKLSGSNRECNAFCRSGNLRKGRWFKKKCMHFILRNTCIMLCI